MTSNNNDNNKKVDVKSIIVVCLSLVFSIIIGVASRDLWLGGTILLTGILSAYFASIGKRINYIFGLINYILMGYVAFNTQLYGMASFYIVVCAPLQIWGFINWGKSLEGGRVKSRKFTMKTSVVVILSCLVGSALVGYSLSLIPGERLSFLDAASNCINLCGIILMNLRYAEAWWVWLANNVIDSVIWGVLLISGSGSNTIMMFVTSVAFLAINVYGIAKWTKASKVEGRK